MTLGELTITASTVAWYGAIVATLSILIALLSASTSVYAVRRDRTKLRIRVQAHMMLTSPLPGMDTTGPFVIIDVANVGRRPIHLTALPWFTQHRSSESLLVKGEWQPSPHLDENKSAMYLAIQDQVNVAKLKAVHVKDETGRVWKQRVKLKAESRDPET